VPDPSPLGTALSAADSYFHTPRYREPTWTETNWFGFLVPEARMRGSAYVLFKTNLGVARSAVLVYSRPSRTPVDLDYIDDRSHLPIPPGNLDDYHLTNGLSVKMAKPMREWQIRFEGRYDTRFDLRLEAMMPPVSTMETRIPDAGPGYAVFQRGDDGTGHLDQTLWVEGEVVVRGRRHEVAFPSNRDHSWSPRREWGHNICGNFDEGHFGRGLSFHVQTRNDPLRSGKVTNGYVLRDGSVRTLKHGAGHYRYEGWRIVDVLYELEDDNGDSYQIAGTPVSWCHDVMSGNYAAMAVVRWQLEGEEGWGDIKWHWDIFKMQEWAASHGGEPGHGE
jgi:hypothetical protein